MQHILLDWEVSSKSGWGMVGLNLFLQWAVSSDVRPMMLFPIAGDSLQTADPARFGPIQAAIEFSNQNAEKLLAVIKTGKAALDIPVVHAIGNTLETIHKGRLTGRRNIARFVFEVTGIGPKMHLLDPYDAFVCASEWNARILRTHTKKPVHVIHECADPLLFFPGEKSGTMDSSRFYIFTGGKIEFRKGQDLVLLAFREFSKRHDDAVLVTMWHSPWPNISLGFKGRLQEPLVLAADGRLDIKKWIVDNGIDPGKVTDLAAVPNQLMSAILREMDCALQPSRAEGATNAVVTEAMACGLPVIVGRNTGMLDVIDGDNCVPLLRQSPVEDVNQWGQEGWGESDVEEIVAALEKLYASRELRKQIGAKAGAFMKGRNWEQHAHQLKEIVLAV